MLQRSRSTSTGMAGSLPGKLLRLLLLVLCIHAFLTVYCIDTVSIRGRAMLPALVHGQRLRVFRLPYGIRPPFKTSAKIFQLRDPSMFSVVPVYKPGTGSFEGLGLFVRQLSLGLIGRSGSDDIAVLRVAGLPGDLIRLDEAGVLHRNMQKVDRSFLGYAVLGEKAQGTRRDFIFQVADTNSMEYSIEESTDAAYERQSRFAVFTEAAHQVMYRMITGPEVLEAEGLLLRPYPPLYSDQAGYRGLAAAYIRAAASTPRVIMGDDAGSLSAMDMPVLMAAPDGRVWISPGDGTATELFVLEGGALWLKVPEGSYFLLADNRDEGVDSRSFGPVKKNYLIGASF